MKAFKRLIARWARHGCELDDEPVREKLPPLSATRGTYEGEPDLNITVKAAIGGRIVQFRHYDGSKDRNTFRTYIITDAEPFEASLGKIITMEAMRL